MGLVIALTDVVNIVGADDLELKFLRQFQQVRDDLLLFGHPVVHQFDDEKLTPENIDKATAGFPGGGIIAVHQKPGNDSGEASGKPDQSPGVFRQVSHADTGVAVKAFGMSLGNQFGQVLVAFEVPGQEPHVKGALFRPFLIGPGKGILIDEINLTSEQGFDIMFFRLFEKTGKTEKDTVIGDGESFHAQFLRPLTEGIDATASVKQTVVGVNVQMNKFFILGHG